MKCHPSYSLSRSVRPLLPVLMVLAGLTGCEPEVKIVSVEPATISFNNNEQTNKIEAKGLELNDTPVPNVTFTYRSDNTAIAEVSGDGVVKPVANGNANIVVTSANGKEASVFVKVCMPEKLKCDPDGVLNLRVGTAGPIKCQLIDCTGEPTPGNINYIEADKDAIMKDGENTFIGKKVGETQVTVKGGGLEKIIKVQIAEQIFSPGMEPGHGGGGGGGGGSQKADREKDPYNEKGNGQFDHILGNMKY